MTPIQLLQKLPLAINRLLTLYHNPSSASLPFTTTTCNERNTTHAWLSTPLTLWPAFHQRLTSRIPTSPHQIHNTHTHSQAAPPPSHITPLRFYPVPTAAHQRTPLQDATTQTVTPWVSVLDNPLTPPGLNQSQQTTPRPDTHHRHVQTDINAIVKYPSFASVLASQEADQPTSSTPTTNTPHTTSPNPASAANKQPHERWQYVNLIPTPTITIPEHPDTTQAFPSPIGGTPRHKRSKTPPRSATPTRTRQPDPRSGSPIPTRTAPHPAPQQHPPTVQPLPKRPPPSLPQAHQPPVTNNPLQPVPPAQGPFSKGSLSPRPPLRHPHTLRPHQHTHGHRTTKYQHNHSPQQRRHLHPQHLSPTLPHLPQWPQSVLPYTSTRRGAPCPYTSKSTILRTIPGTPTTTDRAAAFSLATYAA